MLAGEHGRNKNTIIMCNEQHNCITIAILRISHSVSKQPLQQLITSLHSKVVFVPTMGPHEDVPERERIVIFDSIMETGKDTRRPVISQMMVEALCIKSAN